MPDYAKELAVASELAVGAGEILLKHHRAGVEAEWKSVGDPVTIADRAASTFLVRQLKDRFPGDAVLSEEEPDEPGRCGRPRIWIVDPMDGTREFVAQRKDFCVMLGLALEGVAVLGVVYQPSTKKLYAAAEGMGATLQEERAIVPLRVSEETDPQRMTIALSRAHDSPAVEEVRQRLGIAHTIRMGSIGLKVGLICEGQAHLYLDLSGRTSQWDTCAPAALLREAGGRITDAGGNPLRYDIAELRHRNGVIASNATIHDRIVEAVNGD